MQCPKELSAALLAVSSAVFWVRVLPWAGLSQEEKPVVRLLKHWAGNSRRITDPTRESLAPLTP
jgi:hypothetical protein